MHASFVDWETRLEINYLILDRKDGARVARAQTVQVAVDKETGTLQFASPACLVERVRTLLP